MMHTRIGWLAVSVLSLLLAPVTTVACRTSPTNEDVAEKEPVSGGRGGDGGGSLFGKGGDGGRGGTGGKGLTRDGDRGKDGWSSDRHSGGR